MTTTTITPSSSSHLDGGGDGANNNNNNNNADRHEQDAAAAIQRLLEGMNARFKQMSEGIINRIDELGNRLDDLERNVTVLGNQEDATSTSSS